MFFEKVLSFKGAWEEVNNKYSDELTDVRKALPVFMNEFSKQKKKPEEERLTIRQIWENILKKNNWIPIERRIDTDSGKRIKIDSLGPVKNGICASIPLSHLEFFNQWFFLHSIIAAKYRIVNIPVLLIPVSKYTLKIEERWLKRTNFETICNQLQELSPLSHPCPFLIIGYTEQSSIDGPKIIELEADPLVKGNVKLFERESEFPAQFHQAALEILNFFAVFLREQYPNGNEAVTLKQIGAKIRLVVETQGDRVDIIERAFGEYTSIVQKVIQNHEAVEKLINNENLALKLQTQLDFANLQIKLDQRLIDKLDKENERKDKTIDSFMELVNSQMQIPKPINISTTVEVDVRIYFEFTEIIDVLNEIKLILTRSSEEYSRLKDLETAIEAVSKEKDKGVIKKSPALKKLKRVIELAMDENSKFGKTIRKVSAGIDLINRLINLYNKLASVLGIPPF